MTEIVALPWAALDGSAVTRDWPRRPPSAETLIAVPASRHPDGRGLVAELSFDAPPKIDLTLDRCGWASRTVQDAPIGLEGVRLVIRRQRWQTRDKAHQYTSPVPAALTDLETGGLKVTPALTAFVQDVQSRLDISPALVVRSLGDNRQLLTRIRRGAHGAPREAGASLQTDQYILRRPARMVRYLAMDEISLGGQYWTVLTNNDPDPNLTLGQRVIGLCRGREVADLLPPLRIVAAWYREWCPAQPRPTRVTADMWDAFWLAARAPDVFGDRVLFATDPFHLRGHIRTAHMAAERVCGSCCTDVAPCARRQYNKEAAALLLSIWQIGGATEWRAFKAHWYALRSRPGTEIWLEPYARFDRMMRSKAWGSRLRVLGQTFGTQHEGRRPSNARAEAVNGQIRKTMSYLRFRRAEGRLERIMAQLHAAPVTPQPQPVLLSPELLRCPGCRGRATLPPRTTWRSVLTLPRGLAPLALREPTRVLCSTCGVTATPDPGPVTPELAAWLCDPLQEQFNGAALERLTDLSAAQLGVLRGFPDVSERCPCPPTVIYDEIWTSSRVWLMLATPTGALLDLRLVPEPLRAADSTSRYSPGRHDRVAQAAIQFLKEHEPPEGYRQVALRQVYTQLNRALKEAMWQDHEERDWPHPFTLAPYAAHKLPWQAYRAILRHLRARGVIGRTAADATPLRELFKEDPVTWANSALWNTLSQEHQLIAQLFQEAVELKLMLKRLVGDASDEHKAWMEAMKLEGDLEDFYRCGPVSVARETVEGAERVRLDQWISWWAVKWLVMLTASSPPVPAGHHPHLLCEVKTLLQNAPNLAPERQRARILAYTAAVREK